MEQIKPKKGHILVVDDEEGIRYMLETKLMRDGYQVTVAGNGLHALQKIRKTGHVFDLILCDLKMPGMSGTDLFGELKMMGKRDIPFLMFTGYPERRKIVDAIRKGVDDVLLKPIKHQDLIAKIDAMIAKNRAEPQTEEVA